MLMYGNLHSALETVTIPLRRTIQPGGRVRFWGEFRHPEKLGARVLCGIMIEDGEMIHDAFFRPRGSE